MSAVQVRVGAIPCICTDIGEYTVTGPLFWCVQAPVLCSSPSAIASGIRAVAASPLSVHKQASFPVQERAMSVLAASKMVGAGCATIALAGVGAGLGKLAPRAAP